MERPSLDKRLKKKLQLRVEQLEELSRSHHKKERERKMAVRYHKVKFVERVKVERFIKQAAKSLAEAEGKPGADPNVIADRRAQLASYRLDLEYVLQYPKGEKYISILATDLSEDGNQ